MSIDDEINRVRSQIGDHYAAIAKLQDHGRELMMRKMGLKRGDRIIVTGRTGNEFEVEVICPDGRHPSLAPRPAGYRIKKDGTRGAQSAGRIYQWRKKDDAQ